MWYVILGRDNADSLSRRQAARVEHLARLEGLKAQGRLLLAGPLPAIESEDPGAAGFQGSLIVAEFDDLAQAQAFADADPYLRDGVYAGVEVFPFRKVLP